jgi:hypothetical protein
LLLDYWPLGRVQWAWVNWRSPKISPQSPGSLMVEKIPMLLLSLVFSVIAYLAQKDEAVVSFKLIPMSTRILNAAIAYIDYVKKTFLPVDLIIRYPYRPVSLPLAIVSCLLLLLVTIAVTRVIRSRPWWFVRSAVFPVQTGLPIYHWWDCSSPWSGVLRPCCVLTAGRSYYAGWVFQSWLHSRRGQWINCATGMTMWCFTNMH